MKTLIPEYMVSPFETQGIDASKLIYAVHADSSDDSGYLDAYLAVSSDSLYILLGEEKVVKASGARRIVAVYEPKELHVIPLEDVGNLSTERLVSTVRLCSEKDDKTSILLVFSIGYLGAVEKLIKVISNIREGKDP